MSVKLFLLASTLISVTFSKSTLAPFITKCRTDDTECLKANAVVAIPIFAAGIPSMGMDTLDPIILDFVNATGPNAMLLVSNGTMTGLKDCIPIHIYRDPQKAKLHLKLSCHGAGGGHYEMSGKVLGLNVYGHGYVRVLFPRFEINFDMDIHERDGENGKKYFNITNFNHYLEMKEKSEIIFEGLYHEKQRLKQLVTKCRSDDAECMKANAIKILPILATGIPEYDTEIMDPFFLDHANASKLDLKFFVFNNTIEGFKNCIPLDVHRDVVKSKIHLTLNCPLVSGVGHYELEGKVLALDIHGGGPISFVLRDARSHIEMDLKIIVGKDSKKYFYIPKFKYTYELMGKCNVNFENLFQNNKALNKAAVEVINNSGNEIVKEIGDPIIEITIAKSVKNVNNLFAHIPIEDLTIDK